MANNRLRFFSAAPNLLMAPIATAQLVRTNALKGGPFAWRHHLQWKWCLTCRTGELWREMRVAGPVDEKWRGGTRLYDREAGYANSEFELGIMKS